jgi:hypothetical protein
MSLLSYAFVFPRQMADSSPPEDQMSIQFKVEANQTRYSMCKPPLVGGQPDIILETGRALGVASHTSVQVFSR